MNEELQVENGSFTRIVNPLIEQLIKVPFKGCELSVALFIIRKTYGYQKKQDEISLTQFQVGVNRSRQTVVTALKNLQLVNIARLVKRGNMKGDSNVWAINKYYDTWKLGNTARLVKRKRGASLMEAPNLVKTARHTKEITKEKASTKEMVLRTDDNTSKFIFLFKEINPSIGVLYGRPPQRAAAERLLKLHDLEWWQRFIEAYSLKLEDKFCPRATTPIQLEEKLGAITVYAKSLKDVKNKVKFI